MGRDLVAEEVKVTARAVYAVDAVPDLRAGVFAGDDVATEVPGVPESRGGSYGRIADDELQRLDPPQPLLGDRRLGGLEQLEHLASGVGPSTSGRSVSAGAGGTAAGGQGDRDDLRRLAARGPVQRVVSATTPRGRPNPPR